jgi:endonuclease III
MANPFLAQHFRHGGDMSETGAAAPRATGPEGRAEGPERGAAWLVARMGPATPARLGLRPAEGDETDRFGWWAACLLRAGERREARVAAALAAMRQRGWLAAPALAGAGEALARALAEAGLRTPEVVAARLVRASAALVERHAGSLDRLAAGEPELEEVGRRLVALGPGLGPGTALRFLRPLRDRWAAADAAPLDPAALAAAAHLGWLDEHDDLDGAPAMLRRRLADEDGAPTLPDVEDALERLGRAACRRANTRRCPLGDDCPARGSDDPALGAD